MSGSLGPAQSPAGSPTPDQIRLALNNSICVLPVGQTIDVGQLPPGVGEPLNWMAELSSSLPISRVSIPATHDAGTALGTFGWSRCQILTIPAQLRVGIRGFDIRLRLVGDDLKIYHSQESQKLEFDSVMESFRSFLKAHPSEFLVMRVRQEADPISATESFESAFAKVRNSPNYRSLFYRAKQRTEIPTVGKLRGKILVLDNYGKLPDSVDYPNPTMSVQDDYDTSDMDHKFQEIGENFDAADHAPDGSVWYVNYTSSCNAQVDQLLNAVRINPRVEATLRTPHRHLGLLLMNFPGLAVIHEIVASNF